MLIRDGALDSNLIYIIIGTAILLLGIICWLIIRIVLMKQQIKSISKQLKMTRDLEYNKLIQVLLVDNDIVDLASVINDNIDYQKRLKLAYERTENNLKQSISDIAHDLRTPLTVIKGNLQLLKQKINNKNTNNKNINDNSNMDLINICMEKSDVLKTMIDDFFELSVIESDVNDIPLQSINITKLLIQFIIDNEVLIREKNLTPEIVLPDKSVMVMGDISFIGRMLSNLLNNILKYGKDKFEIGLNDNDDCVTVYFSNIISSHGDIDIDRIFDRTYRADRARREGSAGLGLYIVKVLAQKQGGSASAEIVDKKLKINLTFKKVAHT